MQHRLFKNFAVSLLGKFVINGLEKIRDQCTEE